MNAEQRLNDAAPRMYEILCTIRRRMELAICENPDRSFPGRTYLPEINEIIQKVSEE